MKTRFLFFHIALLHEILLHHIIELCYVVCCAVTVVAAQYPEGNFIAVTDTDNDIRAFFNYVRGTLENNGSSSNTVELVDVRGPKEFTGEVLAPPEYPTEHAQRGGHIPGAKNIPWSQAVNDNDGTFRSVDELKKLYESKGITPNTEVIAYCRIGERSSHTWFVLIIPLCIIAAICILTIDQSLPYNKILFLHSKSKLLKQDYSSLAIKMINKRI